MPKLTFPRSIRAYSFRLSEETGISLRTVIRWATDETDSSPATAYACEAASMKIWGMTRDQLIRFAPLDDINHANE